MQRKMTVTAQVELAIEDVMRRLSDQPGADDLLRAAIVDALGAMEGAFALHLSEPERIAERSARLQATWQAGGHSDSTSRRGAAVHLFALQSGSAPLTELVVTMTVEGERAHPIAERLHSILDAVTARLVSTGAV